jgi:hypothetical protein
MSGLSDRLMRKQIEVANINAKCNKSPYNEITIENIIVAFVILASGASIALISVCFESILRKMV